MRTTRIQGNADHQVIIEDYARLRHHKDGSVDFLIVDTLGRATEYCFNEEGELKTTRKGIMEETQKIETVEL